MPGRSDGLWVVWPHAFDVRRSRQAGRRVAKALAVEKPDAAWIHSAAKKAGFTAELQEAARHPSKPYETVGRVLVKADGSKEAALRKIAEQLSS